MKQISRESGNRIKRLFSQLAAEKKKSVVALCLTALMALMWIRVLGGKTPQSAEGAPTAQEATIAQSNSELKISFMELPKVVGRNDILTRDFFVVDGERLGGFQEVNVVSKDGREEVAKRVAKKLKLEAIGLGKNPHAFINDKLLSVGDKLLVKEGGSTYECEVVGIEEKTVVIRCGEAEITLKLTQATITDY